LPAALCPGVKFPAVAEFPNQDQWFLSWLFIYNSGNSPAFILVSARIMTLIAGVFLGLLVFFISRSYFGPLGALISLCFYSFSPAILAHSRLAVSDLIVAFMFLSAAWSVWLAFQRLSISRIFLGDWFCACLSQKSLFLTPDLNNLGS
jgi:dolichyl-phosphate-mannose--protein O-mannosyl transferase